MKAFSRWMIISLDDAVKWFSAVQMWPLTCSLTWPQPHCAPVGDPNVASIDMTIYLPIVFLRSQQSWDPMISSALIFLWWIQKVKWQLRHKKHSWSCFQSEFIIKDNRSSITQIDLLLFEMICLLWPIYSHCCPQRNDVSSSDVSGEQSLDPRSWPSFVVPFIYGEVVLTAQCTYCICAVLAALNIINYITLLMPECFVLRRDKFLPQLVGRFEVNQDMMPSKTFLSFSDVPTT